MMGWTPTPEQREALVRAHELARGMRDGGVSWKAIADRLTVGAYPTVRGGPWTYQMVQRLLRKPPPAERATSYTTQHWRLRDRRGPAKLLKCVDCAANGVDKYAYDWSHRHGTDPEDVMNYDPRCRKCHIAYDKSGHRIPHTEAARTKMSASQRRRYGTDEREALAKASQVVKPPRAGANPFNADKTHCPQDHEYDEENTYWAPDGTRGCKECRRDNVRRWRLRKRAV